MCYQKNFLKICKISQIKRKEKKKIATIKFKISCVQLSFLWQTNYNIGVFNLTRSIIWCCF